MKKDFSETVIRKALYWLSEDATWKVQDNNENFIINFTPIKAESENFIEEKFHRLLNDFYLREKIDTLSKNLREKIIEQALTKVYLHND